jgi:hypothetical protein
MKKNIIFIFLLGIILTPLFQVVDLNAGKDDFLAYWSAAHLLVTGGNPYDHSAMNSLEKSVRPELVSDGDFFLNAWNPPWLLLLFAPLGFLSYPIAVPVWIFCNTVLIGLALIISWRMCTGNESSKGILIVFVAGYLFGETIAYIAIGQITVLVLLGMLLSIWWLNHQKDILAGAILLFTLIKPQISYFFLLIVLIWIIQNRRWKVILGFVIALLSSLIIFWIIDPGWLNNYITLINSMPYTLIYTSTFGSFMASLFHTNIFYFSVLILIFCIKPLLRILEKAGWYTAMNISVLISLPLSPFGFTFDQIIILPAIVQIISWLWQRRFRIKTISLIIVSLLLFYAFVIKMLSINNLAYYWFFIIPVIFLPIYIIPWKIGYESQN